MGKLIEVDTDCAGSYAGQDCHLCLNRADSRERPALINTTGI